MSKEKRNIATKLETESKYLTNILDKDDVKDFKKLIPELQILGIRNKCLEQKQK